MVAPRKKSTKVGMISSERMTCSPISEHHTSWPLCIHCSCTGMGLHKLMKQYSKDSAVLVVKCCPRCWMLRSACESTPHLRSSNRHCTEAKSPYIHNLIGEGLCFVSTQVLMYQSIIDIISTKTHDFAFITNI